MRIHEFNYRNNKPSIDKLCKENIVEKLSVFGSILNENFNENSEIDFLVTIDEKIALLNFK